MSIHAVLASTLAPALVLIAGLGPGNARSAEAPSALAKVYISAVESLNEAHARKPAGEDEAMLARKLPKEAVKAFDALLASASPNAADELARCAESALDLDRIDDFERARRHLAQSAPAAATKLGIVLSRPRYLLRGLDGMQPEGLVAIAAALDEILAAYDEVFGFTEWSKVPGKKLRIRVHRVDKIVDPPHFAPQFPWHSEIDFPAVDPRGFASPTSEGKMLFYGLCHELGHVIAMWGDPQNEQDHHTWAHYTGVAIVEHLAAKKNVPALEKLKDGRWRSLDLERKSLEQAKSKPGRVDEHAMLALWIALHDAVGPKSIGYVINALDAKDARLRVNRVRYYDLDAFRKALLATPAGQKKAQEIGAILR